MASDLTIPAYAIAFATTISLATLSFVEHSRSARPSSVIQVYFFLTGLLDIARVRTAWLIRDKIDIALLRSVVLAIKLITLVLESLPKDSHIAQSKSQFLSFEDKAGFFSRSLLLWLNPLFLRGYHERLSGHDLYTVGEDLAASKVSEALFGNWEKTKLTHKHRLALALLKAFKKQLFVIQLPRLSLVGFSIAQPFLVNATLSYMTRSATLPPQIGYGLIGAFAVTYTGIAIS